MSIFRTGTPVWKKVLATLLCVGVVAGGAYGIKKIHDHADDDLKTIYPTFHVGGLDEEGEYVDTDQSLYSNEFECKGLEIKLDFDNDIKYQVYFYQNNGDFISKTDELDDEFNIKDYSIDLSQKVKISHARIVIIPQWTNVEIPEDKTEEDVCVVKWTNISSFVNQLEIKVLKDQDIIYDLVTNYHNLEIVEDSYIEPGNVTEKNGVNYIRFVYQCSEKYKVTYPKKFDYESVANILVITKTINSPGGEETNKDIISTSNLENNTIIFDTSDYGAYGVVVYVNFVDGCQPTIEIVD